MSAVKLADNVYWVGAVDWGLKDFHGYLTQRGSTYNAYLIIDEKITLVDTVKHHLYDEMLGNIKEVIDPSRIDYIVSNHTEMDHSGGLPKILEIAKNATVIASPNGEKGLKRHFKKDWNFKVVNTGDVVNIGKRNLSFVLAPMVHWPDSMLTYLPEEKLLLSNDAFGQHIASNERFDDEFDIAVLKEEAAKYYANIVLPYSKQVNKLLEAASGLNIKTIAPSHGIIWRKSVKDIVELYKKWAGNICNDEAVIVYDTMWKSTEKMANALGDVFKDKNIKCELLNLQKNHISDIMAKTLSAKYICVGSPTLNNGLMPTVAAFLTYLKGLAPDNRTAIAFGSFGWGGQSIPEIESVFESCKFEVPLKGLKLQYVPDEEEIKEFKNKLKSVL